MLIEHWVLTLLGALLVLGIVSQMVNSYVGEHRSPQENIDRACTAFATWDHRGADWAEFPETPAREAEWAAKADPRWTDFSDALSVLEAGPPPGWAFSEMGPDEIAPFYDRAALATETARATCAAVRTQSATP